VWRVRVRPKPKPKRGARGALGQTRPRSSGPSATFFFAFTVDVLVLPLSAFKDRGKFVEGNGEDGGPRGESSERWGWCRPTLGVRPARARRSMVPE
jgi:hypothetical protein